MPPKHYVDNKKLFDVLIKHKKAVARRPNNPPRIPEYVGECLLMIATRLASKPNFAGYTFKDDMISDAVENGLMYLHNFNPEKSQNPFAYFTQITHYAFIRRIEREKKYVYTKYKYALNQAHLGEDHVTAAGDTPTATNAAWTSYDNIHDFIAGYEQRLARPRASRAMVVSDDDDDDDVIPFDVLDDDISNEGDVAVDGLPVETTPEEDE